MHMKINRLRCLNVQLALLCLLTCSNPLFAQHQELRRGDRMYDDGKYDKARAAYQKAGNIQGLYNAGNAAMQQNDYAAAADLFQQATEKSPDAAHKSDAFYNMGNALLLQRKYKDAINAYEKCLRLQPNQPDAQKNLQIAKRLAQSPPPSPPTPPPPPVTPPRRVYLDQARPGYQQQPPTGPLSPESARQLLSKALTEEEQQAKTYREHAAAQKPSRTKKDW